MALTKEDLQAIGALMDEKLNGALTPIHEKLDTLEEHTEVTRSATNHLLVGADTVGVITQVKFPITKANNG